MQGWYVWAWPLQTQALQQGLPRRGQGLPVGRSCAATLPWGSRGGGGAGGTLSEPGSWSHHGVTGPMDHGPVSCGEVSLAASPHPTGETRLHCSTLPAGGGPLSFHPAPTRSQTSLRGGGAGDRVCEQHVLSFMTAILRLLPVHCKVTTRPEAQPSLKWKKNGLSDKYPRAVKWKLFYLILLKRKINSISLPLNTDCNFSQYKAP